MIEAIHRNLYDLADVAAETGMDYHHVRYMTKLAHYCTEPSIPHGKKKYYDDESFKQVCKELTEGRGKGER